MSCVYWVLSARRKWAFQEGVAHHQENVTGVPPTIISILPSWGLLVASFRMFQYVLGILMTFEISQGSPCTLLCSVIQGKVSNPWNPIKQYHCGRPFSVLPPRSVTRSVLFAKKDEVWIDDAAIVSKTTACSGNNPINSSTCYCVTFISNPLTNRTSPREIQTLIKLSAVTKHSLSTLGFLWSFWIASLSCDWVIASKDNHRL